MGLFQKIKEGLKKTRDSIVGQIDSMLKSFTKIDEELFEELEELLVMGDVGLPTAQRICEELRKRVKQEGIKDPNEIHRLIHEIITEMLKGGEELHLSTKPSIILDVYKRQPYGCGGCNCFRWIYRQCHFKAVRGSSHDCDGQDKRCLDQKPEK